MARNWSNPPFEGTLEEAITHAEAVYAPLGPLEVYGFEVAGFGDHTGETHVLACQPNSMMLLPAVGEIIECSGLGLGTTWQVLRVASGWTGYSGSHALRIR